MKILAFGDIIGKAGRRCLEKHLPSLREKYQSDFVIVNGENAAGGFGLTEKIFDEFTKSWGIDCVTMGNHWHDKREIYQFMEKTQKLVLPGNMSNVEEDQGLRILTATSGEQVAVINLHGKAFMYGDNRCPFQAVDRLLARVPERIKIRVVDMHAEATSEKQALGWYLCGRASLVYGTHSHVPTADERIFEHKTGFVTDLGMTGGYDSVIGMKKEAAIHRLRTGEPKKFEPSMDNPWIYAISATIDEKTGNCTAIERIKLSGE
jgi:metallophosphoesterase (TIGR00282 family)